MRLLLLSGVLTVSFSAFAEEPSREAEADAETGATPEPDVEIGPSYVPATVVDGWEGFFPPASIDDLWLEERSLSFDSQVLGSVLDRVGKVILDDGPRQASAAELDLMHERYCTDPEVRAWNEHRCAALDLRSCEGDTCTYRHFGNCSGLLYDETTFLTAAHCVDAMVDHPELKPTSAILLPAADGTPRRLPLGDVRVGKADFDHHWAVLDEEEIDPVDVAAITLEPVAGTVTYPIAPLPPLGSALFIVGYPRVEGRDPSALAAAEYSLTFGTPAVSFGRLADPNEANRPLCNPDGNQEHWKLRDPCPAAEVTVAGTTTYTGVITHSPFLATYDACNGYSGGPVFDIHGNLIGINVTLISDTDPQDRFSPTARMVAIPINRAIERLTAPPEDEQPGKRRNKKKRRGRKR